MTPEPEHRWVTRMTFSLPLGSPIQLAWVTDDLDACEASVAQIFGPVRWTRMPGIAFGPQTCEFRGAPADFVADIVLGYAGDMQLELIRPVSGESLYTEHLATQGPGFHHVCVAVDDIDEAVDAARAEGIEVPMRGSMGIMEFAYLDLRSRGFGWAELAQLTPQALQMYDALKAAATQS